MEWDPTFKPKLRPVEAVRVPDADGASVALHDRSGLSDATLTMSEGALFVLSLMDGDRSCTEIQRVFHTRLGQLLRAETLQSILDYLGRAHFLEGPSFEAHYSELLKAYRRDGVRPMRDAKALGIVDGTGALFDEMLSGCDDADLPGRIVGLVAPHLDYPRGLPCYAAAYGSLRNRAAPDRVVVLGTNHFGRATSVVATGNDFATPLGTTRTDVAFLERIEARCGDLRAFELDHAREHSIELQVAWLQHLFGATSFELVAFLCPDPCLPADLLPPGGGGVDLQTFARALCEIVADDPRDTLLVAGADLSHVGAAFGEDPPLEEAFLAEVRRTDEAALDRLVAQGPEAFVAGVKEAENATRVCSVGCISALATALPDAAITILRYHQAVDQSSQTGVTCAAMALTERDAV